MFSYYGSKSKIVGLYPEPKHTTIVEPFAGAAKYALYHCEKKPATYKVIIVEKNPVVAGVWEWLISVTREELLSLPTFKPRERIPQLPNVNARNFLCFMQNQGSAVPHNTVGTFAACSGEKLHRSLQRIADKLHLIRDWQLLKCDYQSTPDIEATWYVDPPYYHQKVYPIGRDINYTQLARWCKTRKGQVIVAENDNAPWLPFRTLVTCAGQRSTSTLRNEGIWTNDDITPTDFVEYITPTPQRQPSLSVDACLSHKQENCRKCNP
jgi:site-specific DNA-adenine methylase